MHYLSWYTNPGAISILAITLIFSIAGLANESFKEECMLHPWSISRKKRVYTLITSGLVHANLAHLTFNMFTYWFFAFLLEKYFLGTRGFILLYLAGLLLCDIPTIIKQRNNQGYYSLGASGAISAVLFSMIIFYPTMGIGMLFLPFHIPGYIFGILFLLYTTYAANRQSGNINHDAHLYGALTGIIMAFILNYSVASQVIHKIVQSGFMAQ